MESTTLPDNRAPEFEIIAEGFDFLETPRIAANGDLWFSDLTGTGVFRQRPGMAPEAMLPGRQWVGGMLFDRSALILCSGRGGIVAFDPASGKARDLLTELDGRPIGAVNDLEGDGQGGFFGGTIDFVSIFETGARPTPGTFFHMSAQGAVSVLRRDVIASNGIAASPCGKWLYHVETGRGIWRYPLDADVLPGLGELFIALQDGDGLAVDTAGYLWTACWSTARLLRFAPDGSCIAAMTFPYPHVVSIAFGADDPSFLYITTGSNAQTPHVGAVLRMKVDTPGLPGPATNLSFLEGRPA